MKKKVNGPVLVLGLIAIICAIAAGALSCVICTQNGIKFGTELLEYIQKVCDFSKTVTTGAWIVIGAEAICDLSLAFFVVILVMLIVKKRPAYIWSIVGLLFIAIFVACAGTVVGYRVDSTGSLSGTFEIITLACFGVAGVAAITHSIVSIVSLAKVKRNNPQEVVALASEQPVAPEAPKAEEPAPAPAPVEEKVEEPAPAPAPVEEKVEEPTPVVEEKPAKKPAVKKAAAKKPAEKKTAAKKAAKVEEDKNTPRVYHISRHGKTNQWQVKLAGSDKANKLFKTQKEAIDFAKELSKSTGGSYLVHSEAGKIRKA